MVQRLNDLGVPVTFEEVEQEAGGPGSQIGRPHFAAVLVRRGAVPDFQSAFDEYLAKGAKAYIGRKLYKPREAIRLMASAGVVPVLAHPFTLNLRFVELEALVEELVEAGLAGIEGYHGDRSLEEQGPVRALANRKGLVASGGSDYHGDMVPGRSLGGGRCGVVVPPGVLEDLKAVATTMAPR